MSLFQRLVLQGLALILKRLAQSPTNMSGSEAQWLKNVNDELKG